VKKKCVGCGKQIPSVALDCVFCKAKQPAASSDDLYEEMDRPSMHKTDVTMVGMRFEDLAKAAAAQGEAKAEARSEDVKPTNGESANGEVHVPPQARLTGMMQAVVVPDARPAPLLEPAPAVDKAETKAEPLPARAPAAPVERPFLGLARAVMGIGGAVMIALFFLPWHGVHSWRLLETLGGADFVRQLFYLTGGIVLAASALLPLPFVFRATIGALVAATPVMLGAGGVLSGWRGVVAGLAIVALPATHLLRTQAKSSNAARMLVTVAVAAVAILYIVPVSSMVPIASVFKMIGTGQVGQVVVGVFVLIPLGFAFLSLLGLMGRDLTDIGVLLSVLILLWAPVVVALRGTMLGDMTQVYVALALLWASATSALSLAQLLSLAAHDSAA
jgi:hypothetical protein